jgi:hypothetical protein
VHVFQQLIIEQKIPFGHRRKRGVAGVCLVGQRKGNGKSQGRHNKKDDQHHHCVHIDLPGMEGLTTAIRPLLAPRTGRADASQDEQMQQDAEKEQSRQKEHVHRKKS